MARAVPVQARARARYDSIVRAAREHYKDVGRDRFSLDAVADEVGCSVGTIYRYFEDRVGLMDAAVPEEVSAIHQLARIRVLETFPDLTPEKKWDLVKEILLL